jgi:hypothetical protein
MTVRAFVQPQEDTLAGMVPGQTVAWGIHERRPLDLVVVLAWVFGG